MRLKDGAFTECIAKIAARGSIGQTEARDLLQEVADRAEQMRATGQPDPFVTAARDLADKLKDAARKDKMDALRNAEIRAALMRQIDQAGGMAAAPEALRSILHGTYTSGLDSVQAQYRGLASNWMAALSHKLHALGVEKAVISGAMDEDIAKELWAMNAGGGEGSGNKLARQVAEVIHPVLNEIKDRLNALGARIGDATDYVATTRHDPYKMRRAAGAIRLTGRPLGDPDAAFAAWWADTQPLLAEKTFDGITPRAGERMADARARFGRSVFDALVSGVHMTADGVNGIAYDPAGGAKTGPAFEGTRNLAKKVSHERTLFWKDGAAWNSYVQKYGAQTSLAQGVMLSINQAAKQIALMERFGTNPMANLNQVARAIEEKGRGDFEGLKRFQGKMAGVKNVMAYLDGSANIPTNADWAALGNNIRTFYSIADLGGVGITHFASIWPTVSSELRHHGMSRLDALGGMIDGLLKGRGDAERQDVLSDLGAYADGLARDMMSNWQPDSPRMGALSSVANTFMKYTGIHYVFDNTQAAVRSMLSHNLARNMGKEFGALEPHLQQMLSRYGIGSAEWDLLRSVQEGLRTQNGRAYLTPRDALRIDPDLIERHMLDTGELAPVQEEMALATDGANEAPMNPTEDATFRYAQRLADKLSAYYSDVAAHSTVTAGARERALLLGGTRAGSLSGEIMRFITQFKMWPVAAYDQLLRREIALATSKPDLAWGLGSMIALSTASGYLRMTLNDWALGHPRRPFDWKTGLAALAQGGGLGILGDFMFGEVNRMGGGLIGTLGGPLVSDADELVKLFGRFRMDLTDPNSHHRTGTFGDLWPDLAHFGVRHIPFNNLVYLKGSLDYLLWYHIFEAASPGWWDRTNRRLIKEQGRAMQGYVPGGGVPTGIPYLYMANKSGQTFGLFGGRQ